MTVTQPLPVVCQPTDRQDTYLPAARWVSRAVVIAGAVAGSRLSRTRPTAREALVLSALASGMPHGAADLEVLRLLGKGGPKTHPLLLTGYAAAALAATAAVRGRGTQAVPAILAISTLHFAEAEVSCWPERDEGNRLRSLTAATVVMGLPLCQQVVASRRGDPASGLWSAPAARLGSGAAHPRERQLLGAAYVVATALAAGLAGGGDAEAALDSLLLIVTNLLAPPAVALSVWFAGWHSVRHLARVMDAGRQAGDLPRQGGRALGTLLRRSTATTAVGLLGTAGLAWRAHRSGDSPVRAAMSAVVGLTVPHTAAVLIGLISHSAEEKRIVNGLGSAGLAVSTGGMAGLGAPTCQPEVGARVVLAVARRPKRQTRGERPAIGGNLHPSEGGQRGAHSEFPGASRR